MHVTVKESRLHNHEAANQDRPIAAIGSDMKPTALQ